MPPGNKELDRLCAEYDVFLKELQEVVNIALRRMGRRIKFGGYAGHGRRARLARALADFRGSLCVYSCYIAPRELVEHAVWLRVQLKKFGRRCPTIGRFERINKERLSAFEVSVRLLYGGRL